MRFYTILLVGLLYSTVAFGQTNWQQQYMNAKAFYNEGKHALAMEAFKPIIEESPDNYFSIYASFYYSLAANKNDYKPLAKNMLLQIKAKYPTWSKMDEVNYWLGLIYFEGAEYNQGFKVLNEIKSKDFEQDVASLKYELLKNSDIATLENLYLNHENEKSLGLLIAEKIAKLPLIDQDRNLLNDIISKFELNPERFNLVELNKSVFKDEYKVAVLLPFMSEDLQPVDNRKANQFVLDMYQGIQLALDTLKGNGVNIKLYAYDTKRSSKTAKEIVGKEEMKGMDLIIGPLYSQCVEVVNEFAFKNEINVVHPLSSNSELVGKNPFAFLFSPSNETIGRRSAEYVIENLSEKPGIIIFEDNAADQAIAAAYAKRLAEDSVAIIDVRKIDKNNTREILDLLLIESARLRDASSEEAKESYEIKLDSIGHIFVASSNDLISSKVLSAVETRGDSIVVIGSSNWLELPVIKYDMYSKLGTVLYAPGYNVNSTPKYESFRSKYIAKHKSNPSRFAETGFELMMLFGNALYEHGKYFQVGWQQNGRIEGFLTVGFDFTNSNDNLIVPLLTFDEQDVNIILEEVNEY